MKDGGIMSDLGIVLESGTGELDILHFKVAGQHYAINVVKVKELLQINNISKIPNAKSAVAGVSLNRTDMITIIDLQYVLEGKYTENVQKSMTMICEFNQLKVGFAIESVVGIHKISWENILKPDDLSADSIIIGNINLNGLIVMLLDFEKIVMDINPATGISPDRVIDVEHKERSHYRIAVADDSPMIRKVLLDTLTKAGFMNMKFFDDGKQTLDYLLMLADQYGEGFKDHVDLLITDIEMPQLDGHALTKRIKEHKQLRELPVLIFSSLINDDLRHKGESVGADAQLSKPQVTELLKVIDQMLEK